MTEADVVALAAHADLGEVTAMRPRAPGTGTGIGTVTETLGGRRLELLMSAPLGMTVGGVQADQAVAATLETATLEAARRGATR